MLQVVTKKLHRLALRAFTGQTNIKDAMFSYPGCNILSGFLPHVLTFTCLWKMALFSYQIRIELSFSSYSFDRIFSF